MELRRRVWKKVGWDRDNKGIDPWAGRVAQGDIVSCRNEEVTREMKEAAIAVEPAPGKALMESWSEDWALEESTGLEGLDNILAGDPMDMFHFDEWESLASEFFVS